MAATLDPATGELHGIDHEPVDLTDHADEIRQLRAAIRQAASEKAKWEAVIKAAQSQIQKLMGDAEVALVNGKKIATWRFSIRHTIDIPALREDCGPLLAGYERATPYRTFKLLDED